MSFKKIYRIICITLCAVLFSACASEKIHAPSDNQAIQSDKKTTKNSKKRSKKTSVKSTKKSSKTSQNLAKQDKNNNADFAKIKPKNAESSDIEKSVESSNKIAQNSQDSAESKSDLEQDSPQNQHIEIPKNTPQINTNSQESGDINSIDIKNSKLSGLKMSVDSIRIDKISIDSLTLSVNASVANPHSNTQTSDLLIHIYHKNNLVSTSSESRRLTLKSGNNRLNFKAEINTAHLADSISNYNDLESLSVGLEMAFLIPNIDKRNILLRTNKFQTTLPAINTKLSIMQIAYNPPSSLNSILRIQNLTKAKFEIDEIGYLLELGNGVQRGQTRTIKNKDGSIDIIINDLKISKDSTIKSVDILFESKARVGDLPHKIPLIFNHIF